MFLLPRIPPGRQRICISARKTVGAEIQAITFNEFLPALLGPYAPTPTGQYDPNLDPSVFNEFPTVFLRVGHSMLPNAFNACRTTAGQPPVARSNWSTPSTIRQNSQLPPTWTSSSRD